MIFRLGLAALLFASAACAFVPGDPYALIEVTEYYEPSQVALFNPHTCTLCTPEGLDELVKRQALLEAHPVRRMKAHGWIDKADLKQGAWKEWNRPRSREEGTYVDGERVGIWTVWIEHGVQGAGDVFFRVDYDAEGGPAILARDDG